MWRRAFNSFSSIDSTVTTNKVLVAKFQEQGLSEIFPHQLPVSLDRHTRTNCSFSLISLWFSLPQKNNYWRITEILLVCSQKKLEPPVDYLEIIVVFTVNRNEIEGKMWSIHERFQIFRKKALLTNQ